MKIYIAMRMRRVLTAVCKYKDRKEVETAACTINLCFYIFSGDNITNNNG